MTDSETTRRSMMLGAGGAGLAVVLTACGGTDSAAPVDGGASSQPAPASSAAEGSGGSGGGAADVLAKTADIPKGGGKIFKEQKIVVTQPSDGQFKAFSAICPHQGCSCNAVSNGTINCPCHGSKFSISDGSVTAGPAKQPLEEKQIKVDGDSISLA
ncbi:iron-sulfur protein [Sphaerisporangium siamense]|uniref:Cytochrome bc1 complex Rieske iron-sulfur subunit n=1 Tax=Sphaerisporangium siamense TaxID=795645 RepID=A0A7W7DCX7_9ACTN|nr:Rieske (2Fe-2S) protein [Sphaerisporangium siamense]MBB4703371.1 Rieske Fe-S protein [Sphaerisporangium siamense]GII87635.1 iron-sulfur protein [Sphaerisporangium siamense]